jgi:GGDEF domain-containing protein
MTDGPHGARVPRAVADVPPPALADGEAVAKAWLLELVAAAPLERAGAVPVAELAARGPELCAAVLAAVGSAAGLERLAPGGDRAALAADAGALAGAPDAAGAAAAVAALRRAVWAALRSELRDLDAAATAALAERVAHVADAVTAAVLAPARTPSLPDARSPEARRGEPPDAAAPPLEADLAVAEEPWRAAVEGALETYARDATPFALLAIEVPDAERLVAAGGADAAALVAFERGARTAARAGDTVVRERPGRLWIVAPGLDGDGARALAREIAEAAPGTAAPHGVPLTASAGIAACPEDGIGAPALAAQADERLFAARAAGVAVL